MPLRLRPLNHRALDIAEVEARAHAFRAAMDGRRTVRDFADRDVPRTIVEEAIRTAGTAPSGANLQPWHFVALRWRSAGLEL